MSSRKIRLVIILNAAIVLVNVALFSNALLGVSLFDGSAFSISAGWTVVLISVIVFFRGNSLILYKPETSLLMQDINSLDSCIFFFEMAIYNGKSFDENILKNIEQIKRFRRKCDTIKSVLLQKFSANEMSFQKFNNVLQDIEKVIYMNMRSILNKISAFDIDDYKTMQKKGFQGCEFSQEKMDIYKEYFDFVSNATRTNENILLKLDKMLLEISRYNSVENKDVQKLPAMIEMDELIKNAKLYK